MFTAPEDPSETVDFVYNGRNYSISKNDLHEIVRCRIEELCDVLVRPQIKAAGIPMLPAGIILTGGVSKTEGIDAFVLDIMDLPSRVSSPIDANRMPPGRNTQEYAAAAGIIRYIAERERDPFRYLDNPLIRGISSDDGGKPSIVPETRVRIRLDENNKVSGTGFNPLEGIKNAFKDLF